MILAEHVIPADPDRKLAEQSPEDVDAHLAELRRKPGLKNAFTRAADKMSAAPGPTGCRRSQTPYPVFRIPAAMALIDRSSGSSHSARLSSSGSAR